MNTSDVFLGRQPIRDRGGFAIGHELLFRSDESPAEARVRDDALATARVILTAFRRLGIRTVVGRSLAFVNVDAEMLASRSIESLPARQVVLEILESVEIDERVLCRCEALKRLGFRLALDDVWGVSEALEPMLDLVDIVKVDVNRLDAGTLTRLVERLRLRPPRLLAEKVETSERARECLALGFHYFQGFYFDTPVTLAA